MLTGLVVVATSMTVSMKEAAELPEELKPIVPGGSWFDDMAVERLRKKHEELRELGEASGAAANSIRRENEGPALKKPLAK